MLFQLFLLVQSVGGLFLLGSIAYLFLGKDAAMKRKLMLPFAVVSGVVAVGTFYYANGLIAGLVVAALSVYFGQSFMRALIFCDPCGQIVNGRYGNNPKECPSCHTNLPNAHVGIS